MNLRPEETTSIQNRVLAKYRATLRQRLDRLGTELHSAIRRVDVVSAELQQEIRRVDGLHRQYCLLRREFDQHDQTTVRVPFIPDAAEAETERLERKP